MTTPRRRRRGAEPDVQQALRDAQQQRARAVFESMGAKERQCARWGVAFFELRQLMPLPRDKEEREADGRVHKTLKDLTPSSKAYNLAWHVSMFYVQVPLSLSLYAASLLPPCCLARSVRPSVRLPLSLSLSANHPAFLASVQPSP